MAEYQDWKIGARAEFLARLEATRAKAATFADAEIEARAGRINAEEEEDDILRAAELLGIDLGNARVTSNAPTSTASDVILEALQGVFPKPMKAAGLREMIEERLGRTVHPKTTGMTLYRLAKEGQVRREGHNWFAMSGTLSLEQPKGGA